MYGLTTSSHCCCLNAAFKNLYLDSNIRIVDAPLKDFGAKKHCQESQTETKKVLSVKGFLHFRDRYPISETQRGGKTLHQHTAPFYLSNTKRVLAKLEKVPTRIIDEVSSLNKLKRDIPIFIDLFFALVMLYLLKDENKQRNPALNFDVIQLQQ